MLGYDSKEFARELLSAVESRYLTFRDYIPWADKLVLELPSPPCWICELSTKKYLQSAVDLLREYAYSHPSSDYSTADVQYLGFLWLRYERRELSWATFLDSAGRYSDASNAGIDCEYFFEFLNRFEEADFRAAVENEQRELVRDRISDGIKLAQDFLHRFKGFG